MVTKQTSDALLGEVWIGIGKESYEIMLILTLRIDRDAFGCHPKLPFGGIYRSKRAKRVQN